MIYASHTTQQINETGANEVSLADATVQRILLCGCCMLEDAQLYWESRLSANILSRLEPSSFSDKSMRRELQYKEKSILEPPQNPPYSQLDFTL
jgi:hypothetical protein